MTRTSATLRTSAALCLALSIAAGAARAGSCPAGQATSNAAGTPMTEAKGVTDEVLASLDLAQHPGTPVTATFRLRRLEVAPGGVVPFHPHAERPAIIYVVSGEILEHSTDCKVPILHKAGEAVAERPSVSHWWINKGPVTAVLLSADLLKPTVDGEHM